MKMDRERQRLAAKQVDFTDDFNEIMMESLLEQEGMTKEKAEEVYLQIREKANAQGNCWMFLLTTLSSR